MIEQNVLDGLFMLAGKEQADKIKEQVEKTCEGHAHSQSQKYVRQYILGYERKEKLFKLILEAKQILNYPINPNEKEENDNKKFYQDYLKSLEKELRQLSTDLETLNLPFRP